MDPLIPLPCFSWGWEETRVWLNLHLSWEKEWSGALPGSTLLVLGGIGTGIYLLA